jgi:hypothetical protein
VVVPHVKVMHVSQAQPHLRSVCTLAGASLRLRWRMVPHIPVTLLSSHLAALKQK